MLQDVADACSDAMVSLCLPGPLSLGGSSAEVTAVYQQVVLAALQPQRHNPMTPKLKVGSAGARPRLIGGPCLVSAQGGCCTQSASKSWNSASQNPVAFWTVCLGQVRRWTAANMLAAGLLLPM